MPSGLRQRLADAIFPLQRYLPLQWGRWPHVRVLTYHRIGTAAQIWPEAEALAESTPDEFFAQMRWVRLHTDPITQRDLLDISNGAVSPPRRPVLVTFDDAYRDDMLRALPALRENNIRPIVFIATDYVESTQRFWWDRLSVALQLAVCESLKTASITELGLLDLPLNTTHARMRAFRELSQTLMAFQSQARAVILSQIETTLGVAPGERAAQPFVLSWDELAAHKIDFDYGAHTQSHCRLSLQSADVQRTELQNSKKIVAEKLHIDCCSLAYPYGSREDFTDETTAIAAELGFALIFSMDDNVRPPQKIHSSMLIDRMTMGSVRNVSGVAAKLTWPEIFVPDWGDRLSQRFGAKGPLGP